MTFCHACKKYNFNSGKNASIGVGDNRKMYCQWQLQFGLTTKDKEWACKEKSVREPNVLS